MFFFVSFICLYPPLFSIILPPISLLIPSAPSFSLVSLYFLRSLSLSFSLVPSASLWFFYFCLFLTILALQFFFLPCSHFLSISSFPLLPFFLTFFLSLTFLLFSFSSRLLLPVSSYPLTFHLIFFPFPLLSFYIPQLPYVSLPPFFNFLFLFHLLLLLLSLLLPLQLLLYFSLPVYHIFPAPTIPVSLSLSSHSSFPSSLLPSPSLSKFKHTIPNLNKKTFHDVDNEKDYHLAKSNSRGRKLHREVVGDIHK